MGVKVVPIIVARNEEEHLATTLASLKKQTVPIETIVVVDDGSTDRTGQIAKDSGCIVLTLPYHKENFSGRPELAERWNEGLKCAKRYSPSHIIYMGAHEVLPPDYVESVLSRMSGKTAVASGRSKGKVFDENVPTGPWIVSTRFWTEANDLQYPVCWGWESWLLVKARQTGYETKCFREIVSDPLTPPRLGYRKALYWGFGMYALGYDWKYVLARSFVTFLRRPKAGLSMFWGWLRHKGVERTEVAEWLRSEQRKLFWGKVWSFIKRGGRR